MKYLVAWCQPSRAWFSVTEVKSEVRKAHNQAATEGCCRDCLADRVKGRGNGIRWQSLTAKDFQLNIMDIFPILSLLPNTLKPLKMEVFSFDIMFCFRPPLSWRSICITCSQSLSFIATCFDDWCLVSNTAYLTVNKLKRDIWVNHY